MNPKDDPKNYFKVKFSIPEYAQTVARILIKEGFQCYLAGGALRDIVLGIEPDDYDMATDALPDDMLKIFPKAVSVGAKFGTVVVLVKEKDGYPTYEVQVTTFRSEEKYVSGRWPTEVKFVKEITKDLSRRDFTWNAMAFDFSSADLDGSTEPKEWTVYDPFGGREDLKKKLVRAVGDPIERFKEDGLRAYKACRMAAQLDFDIEPKTFEAITKTLSIAAQVSKERIRDELMKILERSERPSVGIDLMRKSGLMKLFMPELLEGVGVEQKIFHAHDVYNHLLRCVDAAPVNIRLAALFHDMGKPRKAMPDGHFYGHDVEGEKMVRQVMKRLRFSKAEIERTARLVKYHMFNFPVLPDEYTESEKEKYDAHAWTDAGVRRFIARVGEENIDDLFALRIADVTANPKGVWNPKEIDELQARIAEVREKDMALKITDLAVDGNDLAALGVEKGPRMGEILKKLLDAVIEDPGQNTKENLEKLAKDMIK